MICLQFGIDYKGCTEEVSIAYLECVHKIKRCVMLSCVHVYLGITLVCCHCYLFFNSWVLRVKLHEGFLASSFHDLKAGNGKIFQHSLSLDNSWVHTGRSNLRCTFYSVPSGRQVDGHPTAQVLFMLSSHLPSFPFSSFVGTVFSLLCQLCLAVCYLLSESSYLRDVTVLFSFLTVREIINWQKPSMEEMEG